jgi:ABC-type transport system involved in multi-copper enzyme maturation permease subunit
MTHLILKVFRLLAVLLGLGFGAVGLATLSVFREAPSTMHFEIAPLVTWLFGAVATVVAVLLKGPAYRYLLWWLAGASLAVCSWRLMTYPSEASASNPNATIALFPDEAALSIVIAVGVFLLLVGVVDRLIRRRRPQQT